MAKSTDEEFIAAWHACGGSPQLVSERLGVEVRNVYRRRVKLAEKGNVLNSAPYHSNSASQWLDVGRSYKRENEWTLDDGVVIVFSDAHFWPGQPKTVSHLALLKLAKELRPAGVVANGDIFDGARVSRHAPMGWVELPSVKEELEICEEYLHELRLVAGPKSCEFYWNVGNHDQRFDRMLAQNSPEYVGVVPKLEDRFSEWEFAWSLRINGHTMIKHRYHNGIHAAYNNTLKSGTSIVTGHLHRLAVTPWADYNGRRWGVDTGTLSNPLSPQFDYGENNPTPHTSGFAVLTFKDGRLLPPELCEVLDGIAYFRGKEV